MKKAFFLIMFLMIVFYSENIKANLRLLGDANYGTHMVPLITAVTHTQGAVLEMGSGDFSTPLLHAICSKTERYLLSVDTDQSWLNLFIDLKRDWHDLKYVPVFSDDFSKDPKPHLWDTIGTDRYWGVVFIDHRPGERRRIDINRLRKYADIIVVHDTQEPSYGYESILNTFKYKFIYDRYATTTTLVSDTIDVRLLFE